MRIAARSTSGSASLAPAELAEWEADQEAAYWADVADVADVADELDEERRGDETDDFGESDNGGRVEAGMWDGVYP